jgi:Tol biopolymer transport system component
MHPTIRVLNTATDPVDEETVQKERLSWDRCRITFSTAPADDYQVVVQGAAPKFLDVILWGDSASGFYELNMTTPSGDPERQLTNLDSDLQWPVLHPNGTQVFFSSTHDTASNAQLYVADISAIGLTNTTRLVTDANTITSISISPDGTKLVWTTTEGNGTSSVKKANYDADTKAISNVALLIDNTAEDVVGPRAFSPDGVTVAFHTDVTSASNPRVRTIPFAGGSDSGDFANGSNGDQYPAWSPTNEYIMFSGVGDAGSDFDLIQSAIDGSGGRTDITQTVVNEPVCDWSPDGENLVFLSGAGGADLHTITKAGASNTAIVVSNSTAATWGRLLI